MSWKWLIYIWSSALGSRDLLYTLQFDRKMSQMTDFLRFTKVTYCYVHFCFRCCCFYSNPRRGQQFLKKCQMTESTNFILQFHRKMSQMTFCDFFTKVTYYCVHFRFRYCCFYSNPWAAILANVWCAWWPFRQFQFFQSSHGLFWDNLKVSNGKGRPNNYSFDHASVFQ